MAYIRAIAAGNYSNTATWNGGVVPGVGDVACADTFRIVLDVDPGAALSVAAADLVAAGGTAATNKIGGFSVPAGATRGLSAGLRYDFYISSARNTTTTCPLVLGTGTVTLGDVVYVPGYSVSSVASYMVYAEYGGTLTLNLNGAIMSRQDLATSVGSTTLVYINPNTGSTLNVNFNGLISFEGTVNGSNPPRVFNTGVSTFAFEAVFNTPIPCNVQTISNATVAFSASATAAPNQNATYNASTLGATGGYGSSYGKALSFIALNNITFTAPTIAIGNQSLHSSDYEFMVNDLRGLMLVQGNLTLQSGYAVGLLSGAGSVTVMGSTYAVVSNAARSTTIACTGTLQLHDVLVGGSVAGTSSDGVFHVTGNMAVIVDGSLAYAGGMVQMRTIIYLGGTSSKPCTINGDVDARNMYISSNVDAAAVYMASNWTGLLTINGDAYGADAGTLTTPTTLAAAILALATASSYNGVTVNGNVYGGARSPGIIIPAGATVMPVVIHGVVYGGSLVGTNKTSSPAILSYNLGASADAVVFGPDGQFPVQGIFKFNNPATAYVEARSTAGTAFTLNSSTAIVPVASDVRDGVAVGSTVGSLVVPQAGTVLGGVTYDNGTVGTLDVAADITAIKGKTDQLVFTSGAVNAHSADITAIKAVTDQFTFTGGGVVADASGAATDYTARFNTLDTNLAAANTAVAGVKAKTDQLAFTIHGVVADAGGTDYTIRFNDLDAAVAAIPTLNYTARFNSIDDDLAALVAGGGVDFTPVLNAITNVDNRVITGNSTTSAIKAKTDQLVFTANGVTADVSVSVSQVINYDARFDALDLASTGIKAKTDQLTFGAGGVNATASVDTAPVVAAINNALVPVSNAVANIDADLLAHDTQIKAQLTTIQNATGAIDLTPITAGMAVIDNHVLAIPTINYTTRFNALDAALSNVAGDVSVDLSPVLTAVAGVQADTDAIQLAVSSMSVDLSPVTTAVAGVQTTANAIKAKTDTIAPCDTTDMANAVNALEARFEAVPSGPVALLPAPPTGRSTLVAYCVNHDGSPRVGQEVTVYVQQASGTGTLVAGNGVVLTSDAEGKVATTVPRGPQYVYAVHNGSRAERIAGRDADVIELPSMVIRV